ncbi:MAG: MarR family transcriptional regulator [Pseudonocardiales bacterium]|nr:MarR family transcriptional regulator [Pseudonocardiales bacterium]MBV9031706.1 MarR family transcriptional regulator [Pseudonocardiales bacterium]
MVGGSGQPCWLNADELRAWRAYVLGKTLLDVQLNRDLQEEHQLALADYELLVRLSEAPGGQVRMSTLAGQVASSKSRISHQIGRMEKAGLVRREEYPGDRRGVLAVLTSLGQEVLTSAAPTHVRGVRDNLIDLLSEQERVLLAEVFERVMSHLRGQ